jgi:hypothetical protein
MAELEAPEVAAEAEVMGATVAKAERADQDRQSVAWAPQMVVRLAMAVMVATAATAVAVVMAVMAVTAAGAAL